MYPEKPLLDGLLVLVFLVSATAAFGFNSYLEETSYPELEDVYGPIYGTFYGSEAYMSRVAASNFSSFNPEGRVRKLYKPISTYRSRFGTPLTHISINEEGFRDESYNLSPPENSTRVLVVGDSYVFGKGVNESVRFTERVAERATSRRESSFQVINMGVSGAGLQDYYYMLKEKGIAYSPDIVFVSVIGNDRISLSRHSRFSRRAVRYVEENYPNASQQKIQRLTDRKYLELSGSYSSLRDYRYIRNISQLGRKHHFKVIFYIADGLSERKRNRLIKLAEEVNRTVLKAPKEFRDDWQSKFCLKYSPYRVSELDPHPSPAGHRLLAAPISDYLNSGRPVTSGLASQGVVRWMDPC